MPSSLCQGKCDSVFRTVTNLIKKSPSWPDIRSMNRESSFLFNKEQQTGNQSLLKTADCSLCLGTSVMGTHPISWPFLLPAVTSAVVKLSTDGRPCANHCGQYAERADGAWKQPSPLLQPNEAHLKLSTCPHPGGDSRPPLPVLCCLETPELGFPQDQCQRV